MLKLSSLAVLFAASVSADTNCKLPVDVMILQDTTGSFVDDLPNVRRVLPGLVDKILVQNPGSWFGASEFKDKPYRDLGEPDDFCYRLSSPLTGDKDEFCKAYEKLYASGGGDYPEAQLQALINVVQDSGANWRSLSDSFRNMGAMDLSKETGARLIIMSTDANPHDPKDYEFYNGSIEGEPLPEEPRPPMNMTTFPNDPSGITPDVQCRTYDYPTMVQAANILKAAKVMVVFLVPAVAQQRQQNDTDVAQNWKKFNAILDQPESFVQFIKTDSSDLDVVVLKAMSEVSDYVCNLPTETPSTSATTDVSSTTSGNGDVTTAGEPQTTTPTPTTTSSCASTVPTTNTTTGVSTSVTTTGNGEVTTAGGTQTTDGETTGNETTGGNCSCSGGACPCPEVVIKLRRRPAKMHFDLENDI